MDQSFEPFFVFVQMGKETHPRTRGYFVNEAISSFRLWLQENMVGSQILIVQRWVCWRVFQCWRPIIPVGYTWDIEHLIIMKNFEMILYNSNVSKIHVITSLCYLAFSNLWYFEQILRTFVCRFSIFWVNSLEDCKGEVDTAAP